MNALAHGDTVAEVRGDYLVISSDGMGCWLAAFLEPSAVVLDLRDGWYWVRMTPAVEAALVALGEFCRLAKGEIHGHG